MRRWLHILFYAVMAMAFTNCDVHEFPRSSEEIVPLRLNLEFDTEMPLYKTITYTRSGDNPENQAKKSHDIRYIIKAYRTDNVVGENRRCDTTIILTKSDISTLDHSTTIELREGKYTIRVWADYVDAGSKDDKYYDTSDFTEIALIDQYAHSGSNDYRDAFKGEVSVDVQPRGGKDDSTIAIENEATIKMSRPMGKFVFIATDGEEFINLIAQTQQQGTLSNIDDDKMSYEQLLQSIDISQFHIVFRYNNFMPCSFNMFTNKSADSWTRVTFTSQMQSEGEEELILGYDYIFVGENGTSLSISIEVYSKDGELLSSSNPINVPIARGELTVVKGEFLSPHTSTGGAAINPGYEGEDYNIHI